MSILWGWQNLVFWYFVFDGNDFNVFRCMKKLSFFSVCWRFNGTVMLDNNRWLSVGVGYIYLASSICIPIFDLTLWNCVQCAGYAKELICLQVISQSLPLTSVESRSIVRWRAFCCPLNNRKYIWDEQKAFSGQKGLLYTVFPTVFCERFLCFGTISIHLKMGRKKG